MSYDPARGARPSVEAQDVRGATVRVYLYDFGDLGTVAVSSRCPQCGKFVTAGTVRFNEWTEQITALAGFKCQDHGAVDPGVEGWIDEDGAIS